MLLASFVEAQGLLMMLADGRLATRSLLATARLFLATAAFWSAPGLPGGVSAEFPAHPFNLIRRKRNWWLIRHPSHTGSRAGLADSELGRLPAFPTCALPRALG